MKVEELLTSYHALKFFILDSHQTAMSEQDIGHRYDDSDYIGYGYNIHQFNQLVAGSFFLYRRPGKLSPDKKFHIYGGGIVESISSPDAKGNVIAKIKLGFELDKSINQGDPFIEEFVWKTRVKPGPGWKGFWLNYGMNEIVEDDFWRLVKDQTCELSGNQVSGIQTVEENEPVSYDHLEKGFQLRVKMPTVTAGETSPTITSLVRKLDFNALNKKRKTIGTAGELLVLEYEKERLEKAGVAKQPEHVSETLGDGLGYDIKSYDMSGKEIHIEVKTTKSGQSDSFFMSKREIDEAKNTEFEYLIYRVFSYDEISKTANLMIYDRKDLITLFDFEPVSYRIVRK